MVVQGQHKHRDHPRAVMPQLIDVVLHFLAANMRNSWQGLGPGERGAQKSSSRRGGREGGRAAAAAAIDVKE